MWKLWFRDCFEKSDVKDRLFRFLVYLAEEYRKIVSSVERDAELKIRILNINRGHNEKLMESCKTLKEYATFIDISNIFGGV